MLAAVVLVAAGLMAEPSLAAPGGGTAGRAAWALDLGVIEDSAHAAFRRFVWDWMRIHRASENARNAGANEGVSRVHDDVANADPSRGRKRSWWGNAPPWMFAATCKDSAAHSMVLGYTSALTYRFRRFSPASGLIGACPTALVSPVPEVVADGTADGQLLPRYRALARSVREGLLVSLASLDSASSHRSALVSGLRVLMLLEQGRREAAATAAATCAASVEWCRTLRHFVALRHLPLGADAPWEDDPRGDRLWWLSDPLWSAPGNERRAAAFVRRTELRIRRGMGIDEYYDWDPSVRGAALAAAVEHYGFPDYQWSLGSHFDRIMWRSVLSGPPVRGSIAPFKSMEYFDDRVALMPPEHVLASPFSGQPWSVTPSGSSGSPWRPQESMRLPFALDELPGQVALFRRDTAAVVATAVRLPPHAAEVPGRPVRLLASPGPNLMHDVVAAPLGAGSVLTLHGPLPFAHAVIGVEYPPDTALGAAAGRLRLGLTAPPPLHVGDSLPAIATPVLLREDVGGELPLRGDTDAFVSMAPERTLRRGAPLTLYWETYGVPTDTSVEHGVWMQRTDRQRTLVRLGIRLNLRADPNTPVAVFWSEQGLGARAIAIPSRHTTVVGRSMTVQTSHLVPGRYVIGVSVSRDDTVTLLATTDVVITP